MHCYRRGFISLPSSNVELTLALTNAPHTHTHTHTHARTPPHSQRCLQERGDGGADCARCRGAVPHVLGLFPQRIFHSGLDRLDQVPLFHPLCLPGEKRREMKKRREGKRGRCVHHTVTTLRVFECCMVCGVVCDVVARSSLSLTRMTSPSTPH